VRPSRTRRRPPAVPAAPHKGHRHSPAVPDVAGEVVSVAPTPPQRGDRPWWAGLAFALAIVPGVLAAALLVSLHLIRGGVAGSGRLVAANMLPAGMGKTRTRHSSGGGWLAAGGLGAMLGWHFRGRRDREHTVLRVRTSAGTTLCRVASPPPALGVGVGDHVQLRGRIHGDGGLRVFALQNQTTGMTHRPSFVPPRLLAFAVCSAVLIAMLVASLSHLATG
jgi:hypothetical protein